MPIKERTIVTARRPQGAEIARNENPIPFLVPKLDKVVIFEVTGTDSSRQIGEIREKLYIVGTFDPKLNEKEGKAHFMMSKSDLKAAVDWVEKNPQGVIGIDFDKVQTNLQRINERIK